MNDDTVLSVEELSRTFHLGEKHLTVLEGIHFTLRQGETCAIVGPSGSGKSTLLGLCAGLDRPTSGTVALAGVPLETLDEDGRARLRGESVGFIFQSFQLIPTLTALENVMVPLELRGRHGIEDCAAELLERAGLGDRQGHYPSQLSGGEQQRVAMARAFINAPRILFADEPTGNLDADTGELVAELLFKLNQDSGSTIVLVTHDTELAGRAERTLQLHGGKIIHDSAAGTED